MCGHRGLGSWCPRAEAQPLRCHGGVGELGWLSAAAAPAGQKISLARGPLPLREAVRPESCLQGQLCPGDRRLLSAVSVLCPGIHGEGSSQTPCFVVPAVQGSWTPAKGFSR